MAWLNASLGEMVGPGTTQEIFEGDSVTLSVHGKFLDKKKARVNEASFLTVGEDRALKNSPGDCFSKGPGCRGGPCWIS